MRVIITVPGFMQNKPGAFNGMTRVEGTSIYMINDAAIGRHLFHHATNIIFNKISFYIADPFPYQCIAAFIADGFTQLLGSVHHDHRYANAS